VKLRAFDPKACGDVHLAYVLANFAYILTHLGIAQRCEANECYQIRAVFLVFERAGLVDADKCAHNDGWSSSTVVHPRRRRQLILR
jgi:hypothetical protein